jgi:cysteine desulfuration protein SufE
VASLDDIRANFEVLDDWEDRYRYIIELGRGLSPMAPEFKTEASKVRGCASQVWLVSTARGAGAGHAPTLFFVGDSDAHIVRGLIAILFAIYDGKTTAEILATDSTTVFDAFGLKEHLTPQRSNGLASMVERIRADARALAAENAPAS